MAAVVNKRAVVAGSDFSPFISCTSIQPVQCNILSVFVFGQRPKPKGTD